MYQLRPPAPALRPFIEHYWFVADAPGQPVDVRVEVFVDARADLIFNFGAPYQREVLGGATTEMARSNLDAQRLFPIRIIQRGQVRTTGVRFRLGGVGPFSVGDLRPWTNQTPPPALVLGPEVQALEGALGNTGSDVDAQARLLDAFFLAHLSTDPAREVFDRALQHLVRTDGAAEIQDIASSAGVSARQVDRVFARCLGIAPKTVGRILRFQGALRALMRDPGCALAQVATAAGYFDQAHFIRDFKRMSGGVPRGYRGYYPPDGPSDFAPNVVAFVQDGPPRRA